MGRKSTKENKNIYQTSREAMEYTREAAAEKLGFISADRIEKIGPPGMAMKNYQDSGFRILVL